MCINQFHRTTGILLTEVEKNTHFGKTILLLLSVKDAYFHQDPLLVRKNSLIQLLSKIVFISSLQLLFLARSVILDQMSVDQLL